ncbi:hypothetical protein OG352_06020 [Streptomyces sp. NBC_01485]|uniref:hypothetical protein n=1 Tax=Streptomyces sp. NBC_01485 TaxID=2903884 RepID=UPI002E358AB4|nr:hypothetical protein [Streptomyces sp. NBC_01485]
MSLFHAFHAAIATMLLGLGVGMTMIGRSWPTRSKHRGPRAPRRIEVEVPGHHLIPALAGGWPATAFRHCIGCHATVPVVVHDGVHRCDQHGHVTIHAPAGGTQ